MPKGGARVNSGPPPDPHAVRRQRPADQAGWTTLPADGRKGRAPRWPLLPDIGLRAKREVATERLQGLELRIATAEGPRVALLEEQADRVRERIAVLDFQIAEQAGREKAVWSEVWKTPQAVAWERLGWIRDVAQYVRHKVLGELGSLDDAKEARQWSDRLGLNPAAMLRNRWKIAADEVTARRQTREVEPARRLSARDRLKAAAGGDA